MLLSKSAQSIQEALRNQGLETKVVELSASTRTAEEAAKAIGCEVAQIVKSLIFKTKQTHKPILVLASGVNRVNDKLITALVGEEIMKADAEFTREVTGFAIGGIPPIGHKQAIETYIDEDLLKYHELWAAAGTPHAVFCLVSSDLERLTRGKIAQIKL
jgi:prolyl-tRNA editing enzyme YbaK/EbsC (Cys-tRNA(Pro) deacylase)